LETDQNLRPKDRQKLIKRAKQLKYAAGVALKHSGEQLESIKHHLDYKERRDTIIANLKADLRQSPAHVFGVFGIPRRVQSRCM
jgi:phosphoribosyl-ATP pyrophosphohydrolase